MRVTGKTTGETVPANRPIHVRQASTAQLVRTVTSKESERILPRIWTRTRETVGPFVRTDAAMRIPSFVAFQTRCHDNRRLLTSVGELETIVCGGWYAVVGQTATPEAAIRACCFSWMSRARTWP